MDILLVDAEIDAGVVALPGVPVRLRGCLVEVRVVLAEGDRDWSGVLDGVKSSFVDSLLEAWNDLVFKVLVVVIILDPSFPPTSPTRLFDCAVKTPVSLCPKLEFRLVPLALLRRLAACVLSGSGNVPGPIDTRGGFVPVFTLLKEFGGKWLCRRPLSAVFGGGIDIESDLDELRLKLEDVVLCCRAKEPFLPADPATETFLVLAIMALG